MIKNIKKILKQIIINRFLAKLLIKPLLYAHSFSYKWSGIYAGVLNDGVHPKHNIMKYKEWFLDQIQDGWTVLDIGCNTGMMSILLAEKASFVYGIEINESNLKTAIENNNKPNIKYLCADATSYDYSTCKPIDCVIMSNVLEHIENRVDFLRKLLNQVKWNDDSKKRFLIRLPMINREWIVLYKKSLNIDYRLDPGHYTEYTFEQLTNELHDAGIKIIKHEIRFGEIYAVCE